MCILACLEVVYVCIAMVTKTINTTDSWPNHIIPVGNNFAKCYSLPNMNI